MKNKKKSKDFENLMSRDKITRDLYASAASKKPGRRFVSGVNEDDMKMAAKHDKEDKGLKGYATGGSVEISMPGPSGKSTMRGMGAATKGGKFKGVF